MLSPEERSQFLIEETKKLAHYVEGLEKLACEMRFGLAVEQLHYIAREVIEVATRTLQQAGYIVR